MQFIAGICTERQSRQVFLWLSPAQSALRVTVNLPSSRAMKMSGS